jgi:hypothetical protein
MSALYLFIKGRHSPLTASVVFAFGCLGVENGMVCSVMYVLSYKNYNHKKTLCRKGISSTSLFDIQVIANVAYHLHEIRCLRSR